MALVYPLNVVRGLSVLSRRNTAAPPLGRVGVFVLVWGMLLCRYLLLLLVLLVSSSACVSQSKYDSAVLSLESCQEGYLKLEEERNQQVAELEEEATALRQQVKSSRAGAAELEADLKERRAQISALKAQRARDERRLAAFRRLTERFQRMIAAGEIKVYVRRGRMIVGLPSRVLFASGNATLSPQGEKALTRVAEILKDFPERRFLVAGHTDTVPISKSEKYEDNWVLSSYRAVNVTKFLIGQGMTPRNLAAAGYGQFDPIANNKSPVGRQRNRRIEIVLMPNIAEMPKLPK